MFNTLFSSIMTSGDFSASQLLITTFVSVLCGLCIAGVQLQKNRCSKSLAATLVLLPAIVELVIVLVNGNIGAGVAVAGAFSLVRFRSVPGKGYEITGIFLAMAVGLATGMGYVGIAILFTVLLSSISLLLQVCRFGQAADGQRILRITVPENLDFEGKFDDLFEKYLRFYEYDEIKTTNMGSLYRISLKVIPRSDASVKAFLDELRMRNGNLDISLGRMTETTDVL
ncbi:MAG: DUF4956 domain-containing protein [Lachnospiraceae bacterium]|nr:DUF4956 domain-containing protein [Lachnospiraceae bacterium]